jgi:lysophospholipase L1-like esterase
VIVGARLAVLTVLVTFLLPECTSPSGAGVVGSSAPSPTPQFPIVYAAVGASESVGIGATEPTRDSWPQVFFRTALPESTVFYNFGIPGATVAQALSDELPEALSVKATLVTVWLNVNDIINGVGAQQYHDELDQLVHSLRRDGAARVLVANTPFLDRLPAYLDCRAGNPPAGVDCPYALATTPAPALNAIVSAYNSAIAQVAEREGAILVDLHAQGEVPDMHPDWVSSDGFHPSTAGYAAIAGVFASMLKQNSKSGA